MASVIAGLVVLSFALGVAMTLLDAPVRRWWRRRQYHYEECEVCGKRSRRNITLTAVKDRSGGGVVGGSAISATFCPEHDPSSEESEGSP